MQMTVSNVLWNDHLYSISSFLDPPQSSPHQLPFSAWHNYLKNQSFLHFDPPEDINYKTTDSCESENKRTKQCKFHLTHVTWLHLVQHSKPHFSPKMNSFTLKRPSGPYVPIVKKQLAYVANTVKQHLLTHTRIRMHYSRNQKPPPLFLVYTSISSATSKISCVSTETRKDYNEHDDVIKSNKMQTYREAVTSRNHFVRGT